MTDIGKQYIYILQYTRGTERKYYKVGITDRPKLRKKENEQNLPNWYQTISYNYEKIHNPLLSTQLETELTLRLMSAYGILRVRGSLYDNSSNKRRYDIKHIKAHIAALNNLCYICLKHGHFANRCDIRNCKAARDYIDDELCYKGADNLPFRDLKHFVLSKKPNIKDALRSNKILSENRRIRMLKKIEINRGETHSYNLRPRNR